MTKIFTALLTFLIISIPFFSISLRTIQKSSKQMKMIASQGHMDSREKEIAEKRDPQKYTRQDWSLEIQYSKTPLVQTYIKRFSSHSKFKIARE